MDTDIKKIREMAAVNADGAAEAHNSYRSLEGTASLALISIAQSLVAILSILMEGGAANANGKNEIPEGLEKDRDH